MLSTNRTTNYWTRNALARVRFLQQKALKKDKRTAVRSHSVNTIRPHNSAVETFRKARHNYFLERHALF